MNRVVAVMLSVVALPVWAGAVSQPIPEPGIFELLAAGAVAGVIVWARNRRK
jgi:hypothetical protein